MALTRAKISNIDTSIEFFQDPIVLLNEKATLANIDVGFVFNRDSGIHPNVAVYWNETTKSITLAYTSNNGIANSNISVLSYANITVGNIYSTGYYYADGSPFVTSGAANVIVQDEGNTLTTAVGTINFTGEGVTATAVGNVVTVNVPSGGSNYGNANVAAYLPTYSGNLNNVGNVTVNGNLTANAVYTNNYFYANGMPFVGGSSLPDQAGHGGEYLTTNGTILSWAPVTGGSGSFPVIDLGLITEPVTSMIDMGTLY